MNRSAWERAKSLLADVADLEVADRERYVTEHCSDADLRREVLDLLTSPAPLSGIVAINALAPGDRLGPYSIQGLIGVGGMGEVYRGRDTRLGRDVALKVISLKRAGDPSFRRRFELEARAASALNHPSIVTVYDVGEADGIKYIAMEYIHGPTVTEIVRKSISVGRFLPLEHAVFIMSEVAAALSYAHDSRDSEGNLNRIVHRDVSPSNLLVSFEGVTKIVDFGIAKVQDQIREESGMRPGKVSYMAPEQLRGDAVDGRSDIFAMGVILYEITVGRRLWKGAPEQVARRILEEKIPPPTYLRRDYPPALELIVLRALERRPDDRYQTADEMHRDLQAFLDDEGLKTGTRRVADYLKDLFGGSDSGRIPLVQPLTGSGPLDDDAAEPEELDFDRRAPLTVRLEPRSPEPPLARAARPVVKGRTQPQGSDLDLKGAVPSVPLSPAVSVGATATTSVTETGSSSRGSSSRGLWVAFGVFLIAAAALMVFLGGR